MTPTRATPSPRSSSSRTPGKVVYTWDDPAQLAAGALTATLSPDYSYYFVRVTEGDGDLAVTSPVWVGESLKLGISSLTCATATPVTGEELELTTTLFNSEAADAAVKSLTYTIGSQVIGTDMTGLHHRQEQHARRLLPLYPDRGEGHNRHRHRRGGARR